MTEPITLEQLKNASLDAKTLEQVINGDDNTDVTSRLGATYPTLDKALKMMLENGLLGATPFATYQSMEESGLGDDSYAVVTNDSEIRKNGIYQKKDGVWAYSSYNEKIRQLTAEHLSAISTLTQDMRNYALGVNNLELAWGVVDNKHNVGIGVKNNGDIIAGNVQLEQLPDVSNYAYAVVDRNNSIALSIDKQGNVNTHLSLGSLCIQDGDVYIVNGNNNKRLTNDAQAQSAAWHAVGQVKFISNKTGIFCEYIVDVDTLVMTRHYATSHKYEQIIVTGQSLAQGGANAAITTIAPYPDFAFRFANGPIGSNNESIASDITELKEEVNETISTGLAQKLLSQSQDRKLLLSGQAWGGQTYGEIKKGGVRKVFEKCIEQVEFAQHQGGSCVRAICVIHGEADGINSNMQYDQNLREWLDDFNADIKMANKQIDNAIMLTCQTSSASGYKSATDRHQFVTPFLQLKASRNNSDIVLVGPKYHLDYKDHAHIDAESTRLLGEYYAKVYRHVVINGNKWQPLQPSQIRAQDNQIVIDFIVPKPPIVFDVDQVIESASNTSKGFVLKNAADVSIIDVAISGPAQITITTSGQVPKGAVLSYAFDNGLQGKSGRVDGARGNVRDSDDTERSSYTNQPLYNWLVIFSHQFGG